MQLPNNENRPTGNGWNSSFYTSYSSHEFLQRTCGSCGKKINLEEFYLGENRYNIHHRGNETERGFFYHRKCSNNHEAWKLFDKRIRESNERELRRSELISEIEKLIESSEFGFDDLF